MQLKLIIYSKTIRRVSGLQTWERAFIKKFYNKFDITFLYQDGDAKEFLNEIGKYVRYERDLGNVHAADICIYSSLQHGVFENVKASKYVQIYHSNLKFWNFDYKPNPKINIHVAVGEDVAKSLKEDFGIDSIVIPNILNEIEIEKVLHFVTASRIAIGKGFDHMVEMAKKMKNAGYRFVWEIYGIGAPSYIEDLKYKLTGIPEVVFMGPRDKIQSYMACSDYVVQLSDNEGFCYSVYEALQIGKPVIVNNWEGVENVVKNGHNGYIVGKNLENLDIDAIFNRIPKDVTLLQNDKSSMWLDVLKL